MKKLDDILKGFDLTQTFPDGSKQYSIKQGCVAWWYDEAQIHYMTVYPDGNIDLVVDKNCDLVERANDLDEYNVFELTQIA